MELLQLRKQQLEMEQFIKEEQRSDKDSRYTHAHIHAASHILFMHRWTVVTKMSGDILNFSYSLKPIENLQINN